MVRLVLLGNAQLFHGWAEELFERQRGRRKADQAVSYEPVTSLISMLRHLGGVGVLILAALDSSVLPTFGAVDALTIILAARHPELWPYYAMCSAAGSVCGASVAYRLSRLGILHRRIRQSGGILTSFRKPFSVAGGTPSPAISDFRFCSWCWRNTLSLHSICAVFRHGTGLPLCPTGLPRICVRQTVRDKHVVGAHTGTFSGYWRCAGVFRSAGLAHLQEI